LKLRLCKFGRIGERLRMLEHTQATMIAPDL